MKFYRCKVCGKIIIMLDEKATPTVCCGEEMTLLQPGTSDGAVEKHVPVYEVVGNKVIVNVGSVTHPMAAEHYIEWICIESSNGYQIRNLKPGSEPKAEFLLADGESLVSVFAYCNLHGLWKA